MKKEDNKIIICLLVVMALLVLNFCGVIFHLKHFDEAKNRGNDKWRQVEQELKGYDRRLLNLERGEK